MYAFVGREGVYVLKYKVANSQGGSVKNLDFLGVRNYWMAPNQKKTLAELVKFRLFELIFWCEKPLEVLPRKGILKNFANLRALACDFVNKRFQHKPSQNTVFTEHLWTTVSEKRRIYFSNVTSWFHLQQVHNFRSNSYVSKTLRTMFYFLRSVKSIFSVALFPNIG